MTVVNTGDNRYGVAQFIVAPTIAEGANYTTIASAITAASSGQTIFIRPGTYTENLTLKAGVNLTAFGCDSSLNATGRVIILGTCTLTAAGSVTISGIQLQTNSATLLAVTGSAASIVNLNNCYLNITNNTAISFTSSNSAAAINIYNCNGDLGTTGIAIHVSTSTGVITYQNCFFSNSGASLTVSSNSAGSVVASHCFFNSPFSTSSTGFLSLFYSQFTNSATNTTAITTAGTGVSNLSYCTCASGTASCISIGSGTTVNITNCIMSSTNTNAVTGAGTSVIACPNFPNTSHQTNVTTQTGGTVYGLTQGTAPSAGFLGERISATGNPALTSTIAANIASVSLTAGIWDISVLGCVIATTGTVASIGVSATSATLAGTQGDQYSNVVAAYSQATVTIPVFRVTLTATTTYYAVAQATFVSGGSAIGRISAVRVG